MGPRTSTPTMPDLRALLLTDIVESTRLAQTLGDAAMAGHWAAHDRAARDLLPLWRGREIDKTDGLLLLFDSAVDAAGYAIAYHRALRELGLPFKARAGLHVGAVTLRENTAADVALGAKPVEIEGVTKPIAARVMAAALGGQTLLTADAMLALGATALRLQSHGHWRLQGVDEPVELFEVGDALAPFTPPPDQAKAYRVVRQADLWQPAREVRHSLPAERDTFVGRAKPLQVLAQMLGSGTRLVSVLGMGGTGKTRLVTRFGWLWRGDYPGGVWFCDLSQAHTLDGICFGVAQGLDMPLGTTDPVVQLAHAIAGRGACLVVLDNFEQVARHAEETLGHWLDRAPQAQFIVTTREVLGIAGEETLALAPLPQADAVTLFVRRAEAARQGYRPSDDDHAAIAQLVKMLDGLPLAIELAAARVRVMLPRMLLARMADRFKLLWSNAGRRDRQATLRAAFDWSWELLSGAEMAALAQLSVFEGGFTLDTAEAVLDLSALPGAPSGIDVVNWLVDKSFVRALDGGRFDLLESVREYAAEHLRTDGRYAGSGAAAELAAQTRHLRYFSQLDEHAAVASGCVEATNLVAACRRAVALGDAAAAVGAMRGAWAALRLCGPFRTGAALAAEVGAMGSLLPSQWAEVDWVAGSALHLQGDVAQARLHFDTGLARAETAECKARLLIGAGAQHTAQGRLPAALDTLSRALELATLLPDRTLLGLAFNALGGLDHSQAKLSDARNHYNAALEMARACANRRLEGGVLGNLGGVHHDLGELDIGRDLYEQALVIATEVGDRLREGSARCNLGLLEHELGRSAHARAEFEKALRLAREVGYRRLEAIVLCNLGIVCEALLDPDEARVDFEAAVNVARDLGDRRIEGQTRTYLGALDARLGRFSEARACLAASEVLLAEVSDPLSLALLLCNRAEAEFLAGDTVCSRDYWRRANDIRQQLEVGEQSELGRALARVQRLALAVPAA